MIMTLEEITKALTGKYIHFTAEYRSEDTVWGGIVKGIKDTSDELVRLNLIPYFEDKLIHEKNAIMAIPKDELETLINEGSLWEYDILYTQLFDRAPKIGETTLVTIRIPIAFGYKEELMFYAIGSNKYELAGNCTKCSFNNNFCAKWCKKYKCSYLESFYTNKNNSLFLRHLLR